ncbi:MAG TPA: GAF domain-containing protein [Trebonia sp.]
METRPYGEIAAELAALRRVAALVARGSLPEKVFSAVAAEVGLLLGADLTTVARYDPGGVVMVVGGWSSAGTAKLDLAGTRTSLDGYNMSAMVFRTGGAVRIGDYGQATGVAAELGRELGFRMGVGVPIVVDGQLWGVMSVGSTTEAPLPADTEVRLAGFTELVGTAIANAQARVELRGFAEEQSALRRVATLVARGAPPQEVFGVVAAEAGRLPRTDMTTVSRYDPDGAVTVLGAWSGTGVEIPLFAAGIRISGGGENVATLVFQTRRPARIDDYGRNATGVAAAIGRDWGYRAAAGAPITVEGQLWGLLTVASTGEEGLPVDTEARLVAFTELTGTAIANAQAREELHGFAEEQSALRRVATLVAGGAPPGKVFAEVAAETGQVLSADIAVISRYEHDGMATSVGAWNRTGTSAEVGDRLSVSGRNLAAEVFQTGQSAWIVEQSEDSGGPVDTAPRPGCRSVVGVPIRVGGRLWGVMSVGAVREEFLPADAEARLVAFTELAGTAIANAEAQAALAASRARIVTAEDEARRRIERDLHDGAQQRLVTLALQVQELQEAAPSGTGELAQGLAGVTAGLEAALEELREIAGGIHPAVLAQSGLRPALKALARRCPVPVELHVQVEERPPQSVEIAAYYVVSEALANTAKHAGADAAEVAVLASDGILSVRVRDNGRGGADLGRGSGLLGLRDRAEALGGRISLHSPPGAGTTLEVRIPLHGPTLAAGPPGPAASR